VDDVGPSTIVMLHTPDIIYGIAKEYWRALLVGNPCPDTKKRQDQMRQLHPGDLVLEVTCRPLSPCAAVKVEDAIGWLLWVHHDKGASTSRYTIETLGGECIDWTNATFVALPLPGLPVDELHRLQVRRFTGFGGHLAPCGSERT